MARDTSIESLFKEYSFEEIESVKDNLASEIEKRTELLKSIVKGKYRDIVETSDAIRSMKQNLKEVEQSLWSLDRRILEFYSNIKEPPANADRIDPIESSGNSTVANALGEPTNADLTRKLILYSSRIWESYDLGDLASSVEQLNEATDLLDSHLSNSARGDLLDIRNFETTFKRSRAMIKNSLWSIIQAAESDQIGIIANSDQEELYKLSLDSSFEFLVTTFQKDLSDSSYQAQLRRYQPCSHFNSTTNSIVLERSQTGNSIVQVPNSISPELNAFLFGVCKVMNIIAGFNLSKQSVVASLQMTLENCMRVYTDMVPVMSRLVAGVRRKRALQLYFDLMFLRMLLNTSRNLDLIECLDERITKQAGEFEAILDPVELYMISSALHTSVVNLSQSTVRLYGLLIPHLQ